MRWTTSEYLVDPSRLRGHVRERLSEFAWDQWAQMGVLASTNRSDGSAADPESLLLLSFEVGRNDPRLFDEVLDWLAANGDLISRQRLRNLCVDAHERSLADAALAWAARHHAALRKSTQDAGSSDTAALVQLFRGGRRARKRDQVFAKHGWDKPATDRSGKSQRPALRRPINFAFRMRELFGLGTRAEVVRFLATSRVPGAQAQAVTAAAAFSKRNVLEALNSLTAAGVLTSYAVGNEHRYSADVDAWRGLLADELPGHRDWPQLLRALRIVHRWLEEGDVETSSEYMVASEARQLTARIRSDLAFAGVRVSESGTGVDYWPEFVETIRGAVGDALRP